MVYWLVTRKLRRRNLEWIPPAARERVMLGSLHTCTQARQIPISARLFCRFPFVCVAIGLTIKKQVVVGVVYNPILNEVCELSLRKGCSGSARPSILHRNETGKKMIGVNSFFDAPSFLRETF
jgi:hypothetical protein